MTPEEAIIETMHLLRSRKIDYATPNGEIVKQVLGESNGWISVEEELPEVGVEVLTTTPQGTQNVGFYKDGWWHRIPFGLYYISVRLAHVTHWMRLLQPPEKGGEE